MTSGEMDRLALVRELLEFSRPLEEVMARLAMLDWDFEGRGVELTKKHLSTALQRYIQNELTEFEIELWANQIEGREDIEFEADSVKEIDDVLHELANPALTQRLDYARARILLDRLLIS